MLKPFVAKHPREGLAQHVLGLALAQSGNLDAALVHFDAAIKHHPSQIDFYSNYASVLVQAGSHSAALPVCEAGLRKQKDHLQLRYLHAVACLNTDHMEEALAGFDFLVGAQPNNRIFVTERAAVLSALGRHEDACSILALAVQAEPRDPAARYNLSKVFFALGRYGQALAEIDAALAIESLNPQAHSQRGTILAEMHRYHESEAAHDHAVALAPHMPEPYLNRSALYSLLMRYEEAIADHDHVLRLAPDLADAHSNKGNALVGLTRYPEALDSFNRALQLRPDDLEAAFNRSLLLLCMGEYQKGWPDYDKRLGINISHSTSLGKRSVLAPRAMRDLKPDDVSGRKVILVDEQGVGDTIMFLGILPDLLACAREVRLVVDARLTGLMKASFPNVPVCDLDVFLQNPEIGEDDLLLFAGSLGPIFRTDETRFAGSSYLAPAETKHADWRRRLETFSTRPKVGLSWRGGTPKTRAVARSLLPADFAFLASLDADFVNLQFGATDDDLSSFREATGRDLISFDPSETNDLHDLAALISCLDAVVTVQNTNVHVSGALGQPCLAIIPHVPEWRYGMKGSRMPWYASVELFRRDSSDGLESLYPAIRARLASLLGV